MDPVNGPVKTVNQIINDAVYDLALQAAETAMVAEYPWLAYPILNKLLDMLLRYFAAKLYVALAHAATFAIIDFQTTQEKQAFAKAEEALRAAHQSGDPNALNAATIDFKSALSRIIHYDGSAPV